MAGAIATSAFCRLEKRPPVTYVVADFGGRQERVRLGARLAAGGAGEILLVAHHPEYVAKLYLTAQDRQQYEQKIEDMIRRPPNLPPIRQNNTEYVQIAWPTATLRDTAGRFLGFLMPAVDLKAATELENALQRTGRQARNIPEFYGGRVLLAANLAALVAELHSLGHYFTDMKPVNLRFYPQSWYLAVLDTDGMSIAGMKRWPAHQFSDEYIAPEARGQSPEALGIEQDLFALAVIIFRLLNNGIHPYQGIDFGGANPTSLQERINAGLYAYGLQPSRQVGPALASIHEFLEDTTRQLFDRAFLGNYRSRPSALEWKTHLQSLITGNAVIRCAVNPANHAHFSKGCGLCELDRKRAGATTATPAGGRRARQQPPTPTQLTPTIQQPQTPNTPPTPAAATHSPMFPITTQKRSLFFKPYSSAINTVTVVSLYFKSYYIKWLHQTALIRILSMLTVLLAATAIIISFIELAPGPSPVNVGEVPSSTDHKDTGTHVTQSAWDGALGALNAIGGVISWCARFVEMVLLGIWRGVVWIFDAILTIGLWVRDAVLWVISALAAIASGIWYILSGAFWAVVWLLKHLAQAFAYIIESIPSILQGVWAAIVWLFEMLWLALESIYSAVLWAVRIMPSAIEWLWNAIEWIAYAIWVIIKYVFYAVLLVAIILWKILVWIFALFGIAIE